MPQRSSPYSIAIFPITFTTTLSLIVTLSYLQFLYAASYLLGAIRGKHHNTPPGQGTIEQVEKQIIDLILRIIPESLYHSPPSPSLFDEDPLGQRIAMAIRSQRNQRAQDSTLSAETDDAQDPSLQNCPVNAVQREHPAPQARYAPGSARLMQATRHENRGRGTSLYRTAKRNSPNDRPRIADIMEQRQTVPPPTRVNSTTGRQQGEERQLTETGGVQSSEPVPAIPEAPVPHEGLPTTSLDGPSEPSEKSVSADSQESFWVPLSRTTRHRSRESYPGRFPVNAGLAYGELRMAPYAFRERGTTSVRPFSDY